MKPKNGYDLSFNADLQYRNTFWVPGTTQCLANIYTTKGATALLKEPAIQGLSLLVLGGGSNILFTKPYEGCVILNSLMGKEKTSEDEEYVYLKAYAGENWHELVNFAVDRNWGGIENLALIPGTVGAAPIQNIGAYGVELKDVFHKLEALNLSTGTISTFNYSDCQFGYRSSVFKHALSGEYLILSVTLKLFKKPQPVTGYKGLQEALQHRGLSEPTIQDMRDIVTTIRREKLPYPDEAGNAGSFFKNPYISESELERIRENYPSIPYFPQADGLNKIPAAWLIEKAGMKGVRDGPVGTHPNQPLVVANYGGATGEQVYAFAMRVKGAVQEMFGIDLQPEVRIF